MVKLKWQLPLFYCLLLKIMLDVHYYILAKIIVIIISTSLAVLSIMAPLTKDYWFLQVLCDALQ